MPGEEASAGGPSEIGGNRRDDESGMGSELGRRSGGSPCHRPEGSEYRKIEEEIKFNFEQAFMMYLPRLCEHCLNPSA